MKLKNTLNYDVLINFEIIKTIIIYQVHKQMIKIWLKIGLLLLAWIHNAQALPIEKIITAASKIQ